MTSKTITLYKKKLDTCIFQKLISFFAFPLHVISIVQCEPSSEESGSCVGLPRVKRPSRLVLMDIEKMLIFVVSEGPRPGEEVMACGVETLLPNKPALAEVGDDVACRDAVIGVAACMPLAPILIHRALLGHLDVQVVELEKEAVVQVKAEEHVQRALAEH